MTRLKWQLVITVVLLMIFGWILWVMSNGARTESSEDWTRMVYLFGAVEALTFTAVGWLYGTEVRRSQAESAEKRANEAHVAKDAAVQALADGREAAADVNAKASALADIARSLDPPKTQQQMAADEDDIDEDDLGGGDLLTGGRIPNGATSARRLDVYSDEQVQLLVDLAEKWFPSKRT